MRIANLSNRLVLVSGDRVLDVEAASESRFSSDAAAVFDRWEEFQTWGSAIDVEGDPRSTVLDAAIVSLDEFDRN